MNGALKVKPAAYRNDAFGMRTAGTAFSLAVLVPYALVFFVQLIFTGTAYTYATLAVTQLSYLGIAVYFCVRAKRGLSCFAVKKFNIKYLFLAFGLFYGVLFGLGYLNELFVGLLKKAGLNYNPVNVPLDTPWQLVLSLIFVGILPGICEELMFRGIVLSGTSGLKTVYAVLLNGVMFALFHQNPAQTVYPFITGCVFALLALRSGSILTTMLMHVLNNVFIVVAEYFFKGVNFFNVYTIVSGVIVFAACFMYLLFFDRRENAANGNGGRVKYFFLYASVGIAVCAVFWALALFYV